MLTALWTLFVVVPTVFTVLTGDDLATNAPARVFMAATGVVLAASAGFTFRRRGTQLQVEAAAAVGALTLGVAATIRVLNSSGYKEDYPPWGAVLILNVLANGLPVILCVGLGSGLAAWMERRRSRPARR